MDDKKINLNNPPVKFAVCSVDGKMMNVPITKNSYRLFKLKLLCDIFTRPIRRLLYALFVTPIVELIIRPYIYLNKASKSLWKFIRSNPPLIPQRPGARHIDENGFFKFDCVERGDYTTDGKVDPNYKGSVQTREVYTPMISAEDMATEANKLSDYTPDFTDIGEWDDEVDGVNDFMKKMQHNETKNEHIAFLNKMLSMMKKNTDILPYKDSTIKDVTDIIIKTLSTLEEDEKFEQKPPVQKKTVKKSPVKKTVKKAPVKKKKAVKKAVKKKNHPKKKP